MKDSSDIKSHKEVAFTDSKVDITQIFSNKSVDAHNKTMDVSTISKYFKSKY